MVQRNVIEKLKIFQEDHQNRLSIITSHRKGLSCHHQDHHGKTRLPEVKKKMMKKSKSFKLSEIGQQSLIKASSINGVTQPGKPPPTPKSLLSLTPKKSLQSSPNYMKSTSCFEARKEPPRSGFSGGKKAVYGPVSRLGVRTLTKATSFKVSRQGSAKKSPREHVEVRRATCSSTLKDSKFPSYLELNHGGTESDGTSVMKVCPYTYCSLNGHHHKLASLPPLKRFLSGKKRALKAQKSADLEGVGESFFVEIYVENERKTGFVRSKVAEEISIEEEQVVIESVSESSPQSEIDCEEALEIELVEAGIEGDFCEDMEGTEGSFSSEGGSDMEWERGEFSEAEIDDESVSIFGCSLEIENSDCDVEMEQKFVEESACFGDEFAEQECEKIDDVLCVEQFPCNEEHSSEDLSSKEGEEITEAFKEGNVSEKTEESSDTEKQVDDTFDLSSEESRVGFEEEAANVEKSEVSVIDGLDDLSDSKLNVSSTKEDSKGEIEKASRVDHEIGDQELRNKWGIGKRRSMDSDEDSTRKFNPREPNYLPLVESPEGEKVDLKHQEMDERKNSEDWMIDHALQQAVTKLGPVRKRRVALLVEAFETVSPINKFEPRQANRLHHQLLHHPTSPVFSHGIRPIQACN